MGVDLLSLGSQGVIAAQQQLNTTSHNINNINTEGYTRQQAEQATQQAFYGGGNYYGQGTYVSDVHRLYDQFAVKEFNLATTEANYSSDRDMQYTTLDDMFTTTGKRLTNNMNDSYDAIKALADSPSDVGLRNVVLEKGKLVASSFSDAFATLNNEKQNSNAKFNAMLTRINQISDDLASVQSQIMENGPKDNDLADRHQRLINELSKYTNVTVTPRDDGSYNVLIGRGQSLVSGKEASHLEMVPGKPESLKSSLAMTVGKSSQNISAEDIGGKLEALFDYRDVTLNQVQDQLGRVAIGYAMEFNKLQGQGLDANGQIGAAMFNDAENPQFSVLVNGNSTAQMSITINDPSLIEDDDYVLKLDPSNPTQYLLMDNDGRMRPTANYPTGIIPLGTSPIQLPGFDVNVTADATPLPPPSAPDRIVLQPLRRGAENIRVVMTDPNEIAAQSFLSSNSVITGSGELTIDSTTIPSPATPANSSFSVRINAGTPNTYDILDSTGESIVSSGAYPPAPGTILTAPNGVTQFTLSDGAKPDDIFAIDFTPQKGNNYNLWRMEELQTKKIMENGNSSLIDMVESTTTAVGVQKASFNRLTNVTQLQLDTAEGRMKEVSGVNLDEEAANLMKFQQAYMASARIMTAANETFNTLLQSTR